MRSASPRDRKASRDSQGPEKGFASAAFGADGYEDEMARMRQELETLRSQVRAGWWIGWLVD